MRLFQIIKRDLVILGVDSNQSTNKYVYNGNIFLCCFLCASCIILTGVFVFCEANSFIEFTESIYLLSSAIMITAAATFACFKFKVLFDYIETLENTVNSSE